MNYYLRNKTIFCLITTTLFYSCKRYEDISIDSKIDSTETIGVQKNNKDFDFLPSSTNNEVVIHDNYTLSYIDKYEQAEWVAYELKKSELNFNNNNFERPFFIEDNKVKSGSADWRNYKRSGYDKGHLCPAGDRKFSKKAFEETFYTSNISPQKHDFNEGVWNRLEQKVRYWASKYDGIYIVTGGVFTNNMKTIGDEDVAVPNSFYKVLLDTSREEYKMIAFLVPHQDSDEPLYEFVISVDELEKMTGIDFFPNLDDALENKLEKSSDYKSWSF
ncbi:DNA/RNA non-specific endonuclease [Flavobacterium sp.]|uniref:DNA/RNA non-specific endonuclease n=1 Tax=Flavobacterium sp. TaxID=239 RepID=UPI003752D2E6